MSFSLHLFNIENDAYDPHPQSSHKYAKKPCCQNMNIFHTSSPVNVPCHSSHILIFVHSVIYTDWPKYDKH